MFAVGSEVNTYTQYDENNDGRYFQGRQPILWVEITNSV